MTGIESLLEVVRELGDISFCYDLYARLGAIADQIDRELQKERDRWESDLYEAQVEWNRVTGVCLEMERHCLYNEDTVVRDVARWARELRHAMKSDASDECGAQKPSCDGAADPADATFEDRKVTREDRDAITWVREHGGLDSVKKLLDWVVGHCSTKQQLDFDFWLSGRVMYELGFEEDMADRNEVERRLLARLMPEGCEWPRYESGELVKFGDVVSDGDETGRVYYVTFDTVNPVIIGFTDETPDQDPGTWLEVSVNDGERVKRPSKVLDADGVEIRVGDTVWDVEFGCEHVVTKVSDGAVFVAFEDESADRCDPASLTHQRPVLDADGKPLREGEHVYHVETGAELVVKELPKPGEYQAVVVFYPPASHLMSFDPDQLTHERPVLDADGVPIKVGDTVYFTDGREQECNTVVHAKYDYKDEPYVQLGRLNEAGYPTYTNCSCIDPSQLTHRAPVIAADGEPLREGEMVYSTENGDEFTVIGIDARSGDVHIRWGYDFEDKTGTIAAELLTHERPVADTWERIEEDAGCTATKYNERRGTIFTTKQQVARDLVRRAKKLAGVSE